MLGRLLLVWRVLRRTFGFTFAPLVVGFAFLSLRAGLAVAMALDNVVFPSLRRARVRAPIVIVGNPRTGTTFLQRFLCDHDFGAGLQLFRMVYSSLLVQKLIAPIVPKLEAISPARHHKTAAHDTDLQSVETDDVSVLFRFFDGFFLYGFFLAHADDDPVAMFDPSVRDTSARDFDWLEKLWRRSLAFTGKSRIVAKLFSTGVRMQPFLDRFPDAKILYMARDPVAVIPSTMSLVTGVLDSALGFWRLPEEKRRRYLDRLYLALVDLLRRFHDDWTSGKIDRSRVYVVRYDRLMADFDGVMGEICAFVGHEPTEAQKAAIAKVAAKQRAYKSEHTYDLAKFGLDADRIRRDTAFFTETFLAKAAS
ncbi:MAG: sulfotransferase family protein [Myxococcota bacterium]